MLSDLKAVDGLVEAGRFADALLHLHRRGITAPAVADSPSLSLLKGIANARLGRHAEGERWVRIALDNATEVGDAPTVARALNALGAIALETGKVTDANSRFQQALDSAKQNGDHTSVGRCSNNLGIIANLRSDYGRAVGWYTTAFAAFQQAAFPRGEVEAHHNTAMAYRDQALWSLALEAADRAVDRATHIDDRGLAAQALAGRAEVRALSGDGSLALREAEAARAIHCEQRDTLRETEDMRVLAAAFRACADEAEAERLLRSAIDRAENYGVPLLLAMARRDLANLLRETNRIEEAHSLAALADLEFERLAGGNRNPTRATRSPAVRRRSVRERRGGNPSR